MAIVFTSEVLNQFIIIVNAPLRVERSLKYIQIMITFKVFKNSDHAVYTYRYTHCKPLKVNNVNYRFQALVCSSTFALKLRPIDLAFPL